MIDQRLLIDVAAEFNVVPSEYFSLWHELGTWQLQTLQQAGLKREHRLLDIGCGAMRLGFSAIDYLDDGNYYGIDAFGPYIDVAKELAARLGLKKRFSLLLSASFAFDSFGVDFEFANAQSVFTHLSEAESDACMAALARVMKPGASFLFTYLIGAPLTQGILYAGAQPMRRSAVSDAEFYAKLGAKHHMVFEKLPIPHPTGQSVALFRYQL